MYDLDILESSFLDSDLENNDLYTESVDENTAKILGIAAASLALAALLFVTIRKIRQNIKAKKGNSKVESDTNIEAMYVALDKVEDELKEEVKKTKKNKGLLKKVIKDKKMTDKEKKGKISSIGKALKESGNKIKRIGTIISGLAKKCAVPIDGIKAAAAKIKERGNKSTTESTNVMIDENASDAEIEKAIDMLESMEYALEFDDLFESVSEFVSESYEAKNTKDNEEISESSDNFDLSFDDIFN